MTPRERYLETLLFGAPDRIPFQPGGPREKTLKRWRQEGLPESGDWFLHLCREIGIQPEVPNAPVIYPDVNFRMNPVFEEKVLEHKDGHYIVQDWMGNITEISDEYDYTYIRDAKDFVTRKWHAFPVATRADFDAMKKRYNPDDPSRYPADFADRVKVMRERDYVVQIGFPGPFWQLREWCGFEPLCLLFLEDPEFVREMVDFWTMFVSRTMARVLDAGVVDAIWISEDMAYKEKSMISPHMAREFLLPAWSRWVSEGRHAGVRVFDMDSDGRVDDLIPLWIEAGINVCDPIEVAAGCDINAYRAAFGHGIAYRQGVDKRCIAKGGKDMEQELARVAPVVKDGGYIPGCDHGVPHDISWLHFVRYAKRLAEMTGWL
ncbi:MAG TPA: uroporphyrinogen decarboxylase family protein [Candidatus Hydrogenedentes bacterium]|nr:uroporphyrinogen decarboxylase family protein [Candidatus Hydrogenedentota bacterium]HOS02707.1 uroporphyrinogen decarboxylase family protein [Candidatus Hydrogenedentota bacterium]